MATAAIQQPQPVPILDQLSETDVQPKPQFVHTTLNFYKDPEDGSPPHPTYIGKPETYERPFETHPVTIQDVTGHESEYTLDANGFQFHRHVATEKDFIDDDKIRETYYPETEQLLKDVTGASRVFIFDHTIRRSLPGQGGRRGPAQRVHIDQSYAAAQSRVPHHLPDEAEALLRGRVQIVNVWRPIRTVLRDPLAVAEARSVAEEDLVPTPLIYPDRKGETFQVRYSPAHRWFYKYALSPGEVLLIKCADSKTDGRARRVPHTSFADPRSEEGLPPRESIEVRALVFHPDDRD